jgi:hypothetical protein
MPHPFFDSAWYPWDRDDASHLHRRLVDAIRDPRHVELMYEQTAMTLPPLNLNQPPGLVWKEALDNLARYGALQRFVSMLVDHRSRTSVMRPKPFETPNQCAVACRSIAKLAVGLVVRPRWC